MCLDLSVKIPQHAKAGNGIIIHYTKQHILAYLVTKFKIHLLCTTQPRSTRVVKQQLVV